MLRAGFDPDRPLVATSAFQDGTVAAGAVWDWKGAGLPESTAIVLFQSGLVAHSSAAPALLPLPDDEASAQAAASVSDDELERLTAPAEVTLTFPGVATAELDAKITERERQSASKPKRRS